MKKYKKQYRFLSIVMVVCLIFNFTIPTEVFANSGTIVFDFEDGVSGYGSNIVSALKGVYTLKAESNTFNLLNNNDLAADGHNKLATDYGTGQETLVTFSIEGGNTFDLKSLRLGDYSASSENIRITAGSTHIDTGGIPDINTLVDISAKPEASNFCNITSFTITAVDGHINGLSMDDIILDNISDPISPAKTLTADTTSNNVDNDIEITFADDPSFRSVVTGITYSGNTLTSSQYDLTQAGKIILKPSVSGNNYLRTPGTGNVVITATGYSNSTVSQTINAGAVDSLEVTSQPVAGLVSGDIFATSPAVKLKDQYGNYCTTGDSANANVVASAKAGTGTWTIGGTTSKNAVAGAASFTDLTATLVSMGNGAITFTSGIKTVDTSTFTIPQNAGKTLTADTTANSVDNDIEITFTEDAGFRGAITGITYNGNTLTSSQYDVTQAGKVILKPSIAGNSYLRTPGTSNVVITATGYNNSTVSQTINAGVATNLEITTQPSPGSSSGDAFANQPVVKLKDQYNNYCTTGDSASAGLVATSKAGTGTWTIGGTTSKNAVTGTVTFTDLTSTLVSVGNGSITFTSGSINIDSNVFNIPQKSEKVLTADTTSNSVDNNLEITFTEDADFRTAINEVSYGGNTLLSSQYDITQAGKIILKPSVVGNLYLRTPGTENVLIKATGYKDSTISQTINAGVATSLEVTTQPIKGNSSGDAFATQPVVKLKDQYGNYCTTGVSVGDTVTASAKAGTGTWTIGGTLSKTSVLGTATFTDLTATLDTPGKGAITFTSGSLNVDSSEFDIPLKSGVSLTSDTSDNSVDNDIEITFTEDAAYRSAITEITYNGNTLTSSQYDITQAGKIVLKPSVAGNTYLRIPTTGNIVINATGYNDSTVSQTINAGKATDLEVTTQPVAGNASGDEFTVQPIVKLKDKYGNYCTTGMSTGLEVVATAKSGTGSWNISGTTSKNAVSGVAEFTNLKASVVTNGKGSITFTSGSLTIDSSEFDIPLKAGVSLTADTSDNSVDNDIEITFTDDAIYRGAITEITYNGNTLTSSQYDVTQAGKIVLKPSVSGNTYLRIPATGNIVIKATGYNENTVAQTINAGVATVLEITTQPVTGLVSGDNFTVQPVLKLKDQYGNYCTTGDSSGATVIATSKSGTGSWTIGGTTSKNATLGVVEFTDLNATVVTNGKGAIKFSLGSLELDSNEFDIPLKSSKVLTDNTTTNSVDGDIEIKFPSDSDFESAVTKVIFDGQELSAGQYVVGSGYIKLKPSITGDANLRLPKTGNLVIIATGYIDSTVPQTIVAGAVKSFEITTQPVPGAKSGDSFTVQPVLKLKDQYGNYCTTGVSVNSSVNVSAKNGTGSWTIGGTTSKNAINGVVSFDNLSSTLVSAGTGIIKFESSGIEADSVAFTIPSKSSSGGSSGGGTTPTEPTTPTNPTTPQPGTKTEEKNVPVIINGKTENAGTETITQGNGIKTVDMSVSGELVNKKIQEAVQNQMQTPNAIVKNVVEIPISATDANSINTKLTGDIVKNMDDNSFKLMINAGSVNYLIPANEIRIENIASQMGVAANELKNIEVQIKIEKVTEDTANKIAEDAAKKNMSVVVKPVEFSIVANTVSKDGTTSEVTISKFTQYVERVIEIPEGVDPSKITTGVVYNDDGSFAHIPTEIVIKDSKYYARLNSPTNSKYSVIWNPIKVASVKNHWSKDSVEDMASRLVIENPNSFEPNRAITRGEFIDVVTKGLGIYRPQIESENKFNDVSKTSKYYNGVLTGVNYGLINGYKDGSFKPNQKITREEAMAIYAKAMDIAKLEATDVSKLKSYKDVSKVSSWAYDSVDKVVASGIFSGRSASQISPKDNITCAEAVVAMRNLLVRGNLINK